MLGVPRPQITCYTLSCNSAHVISGVLADVMVQPNMRADNVHLTAQGYQAMAQRIADEMKVIELVE